MNKPTQHTPGEWTFAKINEWPFGVKVTAADGRTVHHADAYGVSTAQRTRADNEAANGFDAADRPRIVAAIAEQDANGRLIAAAPDLLAACKAAVDAGLIPQPSSLPNKTATEIGRVVGMMYAAIANAEGQ